MSGCFRYAWVRKQDGWRRRNRDEILAEKLVLPEREGYGYWAPGKFRKIFLALPPILVGSNISRGLTLLGHTLVPPEVCTLSRTRRLYIHLGTSCFTAWNVYSSGSGENFMKNEKKSRKLSLSKYFLSKKSDYL